MPKFKPKQQYLIERTVSPDTLKLIHDQAENDFGAGTTEQRYVLKMILRSGMEFMESYPLIDHYVYIVKDSINQVIYRFRVSLSGISTKQMIFNKGLTIPNY